MHLFYKGGILLPFFYYLTSRVREATEDKISLILSPEDISYLSAHNIPLEKTIGKDNVERYLTSVSILKEVFCV